MIEIFYKKDCQCNSTSSGPRFYSYIQPAEIKEHEIVYRIGGGFAHMVCDSCDKP